MTKILTNRCNLLTKLNINNEHIKQFLAKKKKKKIEKLKCINCNLFKIKKKT